MVVLTRGSPGYPAGLSSRSAPAQARLESDQSPRLEWGRATLASGFATSEHRHGSRLSLGSCRQQPGTTALRVDLQCSSPRHHKCRESIFRASVSAEWLSSRAVLASSEASTSTNTRARTHTGTSTVASTKTGSGRCRGTGRRRANSGVSTRLEGHSLSFTSRGHCIRARRRRQLRRSAGRGGSQAAQEEQSGHWVEREAEGDREGEYILRLQEQQRGGWEGNHPQQLWHSTAPNANSVARLRLLLSPASTAAASSPVAVALSRPTGYFSAEQSPVLVQTPAEMDGGEVTPLPNRGLVPLTCSRSFALLNVLAFGYAATAVVVKAMSDGSGILPLEVEAATAMATSTAASLAPLALPPLLGGGCLCLVTALEFGARFSAAAAASAALLWFSQRRSSSGRHGPTPAGRTAGNSTGVAGLELGLWMFVTYAAQAIGLQTTSAHDAALILTASVVLVPFLEALAGSALPASVWSATALACSGLFLLESGEGAAAAAAAVTATSPESSLLAMDSLGSFLPLIPMGHVWCLIGAVASAVHVVRSEQLCSRHSPVALVHAQLSTSAALGGAWVALALLSSAVAGPSLPLSLSAAADMGSTTMESLSKAWAGVPWGLLLLSGPVGTGLCEWLELEALLHVKASTATLILTASPLWASLLGFLTLGEVVTPGGLAGAALILGASLQVQLSCPCKEEVPAHQQAPVGVLRSSKE